MKRAVILVSLTLAAISALLFLPAAPSDSQSVPEAPKPAANATADAPSQPTAAPAATADMTAARAMIAESRNTMRLLTTVPARLESDGTRTLRDLSASLFATVPLGLVVAPEVQLDSMPTAFVATAADCKVSDVLAVLCRAAELGWTVQGKLIQFYPRHEASFERRFAVTYDVVDIMLAMLQRDLTVRAMATAAPAGTDQQSAPDRRSPVESVVGRSDDLAQSVALRIADYVTEIVAVSSSDNAGVGTDGILAVNAPALELSRLEDFLSDLRLTLKIGQPKQGG